MVGQKSSGEPRKNHRNPVHTSGYSRDTEVAPPQAGFSNIPGNRSEDGCFDDSILDGEKAPNEPDSDYQIDDPTGQIWWKEIYEGEPSDAFSDVFEDTEIDIVYGRQDEFIDQEAALNGEELEEVEAVVDETYDSFSEFVEDIRRSEVHPQHTKQIERAIENDIYQPTAFSDYDGFPERHH